MNKVINYSMYANLPYRQEDVMDLKGRDFLTLKDYTPEEILYLIDLAAELKDKKKKGILTTDMHAGKNIALIFEKTSTRTRCSFEVACLWIFVLY